jgi:hypothetical protein
MIYFAVYLEDQKHFSNLECVGSYLNYDVYKVEHHVFIRLEFANRRVVFIHNEDVAISSRVAGARRDFVRVSGDLEEIKKRFSEELLVPHKPLKWNYYLTDEDKKNTVIFMKIIIRDTIFKHFENMYLAHKTHTSLLHDLLALEEVEPNKLLLDSVSQIDDLVDELNLVEDIAGCNDFVEKFQRSIGL